eukprot:CAMPEP_0119090576 /NCGR_PEP_ID=MMETSP1178-20130426/153215_1 /TAXON_ID=33656 /ORGANISM="unid sp, Strain CCMP2000" /LENGTH=73 /DNA_ID=CAMNT_0007074017 /DNA_START=72 /DNA_END=290 /DNA_ORIENTATION=+
MVARSGLPMLALAAWPSLALALTALLALIFFFDSVLAPALAIGTGTGSTSMPRADATLLVRCALFRCFATLAR